VVQEEIPAPLQEEAQFWRTHLLDRLSNYSDEMIELLLADQPVPADLIRRVLRQATIHHRMVPVLCGSALDGIGVQPVMDAVVDYLPSPADLPPVEGMDPEKKDRKLTRKPDPKEPFCGLVFKVVADRHGDMFWVRIYSGQLKANSRVLNPGKNKRENVPQLWRIQADDREQIDMAEAGDIVGLIGLHHSTTGDTLCDPRHPILLESIRFPETVISMAVEPENAVERKKLAQVLEMLKRQDPTFRAQENEETGQTLISGMGELHLEIIKHRLIRDFKLNVRVHKPKVSYRETIEKAVEVTGLCHRQWGGQNLFAEVKIRMEPTPIGQGTGQVEVLAAGPEVLPPEFLAAVLDELQQQALGGGSLGFPLLHVRITVLGGQVHPTDSNATAFRMAANDAFHKGLREAGVVLLEPIMRVEVAVPDEYVGDIVSDLQQRRAVITRTHPRGRNMTVIEARAPLANLFGYSNAMRGLSQGRASCSLEPCAYGPAPPEVVQSFLL
jgi:elongation factor G